jgi:ribosome-associated protein
MSDLFIRSDLTLPAAELIEKVSTSGGPGGQHANKTSTRVTLRWSVVDSASVTDAQRAQLLQRLASRLTKAGELVIHADDTRSQSDNRRLARERLAAALVGALHVPKVRRPTRPTRASQRRRVEGKKRRGAVKRGRGAVNDED